MDRRDAGRPGPGGGPHQLKKLFFSTFCAGCLGSNWSAPKADTFGLIPPVPTAIVYSAMKMIAAGGVGRRQMLGEHARNEREEALGGGGRRRR